MFCVCVCVCVYGDTCHSVTLIISLSVTHLHEEQRVLTMAWLLQRKALHLSHQTEVFRSPDLSRYWHLPLLGEGLGVAGREGLAVGPPSPNWQMLVLVEELCYFLYPEHWGILWFLMKWAFKKLTTPGIPRTSPIQVLTRPDTAWLPRSDEIGRAQRGVAVSRDTSSNYAIL